MALQEQFRKTAEHPSMSETPYHYQHRNKPLFKHHSPFIHYAFRKGVTDLEIDIGHVLPVTAVTAEYRV